MPEIALNPPPFNPPEGGGDPFACFNPLHCGAVVASERPTRRTAGGQGGFNPLHCGAVVASLNVQRQGDDLLIVSIPFIAGQWSLHEFMVG